MLDSAPSAPHVMNDIFYDFMQVEVMVTQIEVADTEKQLLNDKAFQAVYDILPYLIAYIDRNRHYLYANEAYASHFGVSKEEIVGKHISEVLGLENYRKVKPVSDKGLAGEGSTFSFPSRDAEGKARFFDAQIIPATAGGIGYVAVLEDVTQRKLDKQKLEDLVEDRTHKLRSNEMRLQGIIEASYDLFWETDENHHFVYVSKPAAFAQKLSLPELIEGCFIQRPDGNPESFFKNALSQHIPFLDMEAVVTDEKGETQYLSLSGKPSFNKDGEFVGYLGAAHDITQFISHEETLYQAKKKADAANKAKSQFLSSMSHELRTPLNSVIGFSQLMLSDPRDHLSEKHQNCAQNILKAGEHLLTLINDILDLAKIESGNLSLSLEEIAVSEVSSHCHDLLDTVAEQKKIRLLNRVDGQTEQIILQADLTRLRQVMLNLLSNAIKYTPMGGEVAVDCQVREDGFLRFRVSDTGPGLSAENIGQLFRPFQRLGAEGGAIEGTGIGLTIAKQLIELMQGKIGVESVVAKGSCFWVDVPIAKMPAASKKIPDRNGDVRRKRMGDFTILYIEDNPSNLQLMEAVMERVEGVQLMSSPTAEIGVQLSIAHQPDLVLMDIHLPGMNGLEALEFLKTDKRTTDLEVMALSANVMPCDVEAGLKAGFSAYLTKPLDVPAFLELLEEKITQKNSS
ncbi:ATP-binding protein [Terasakiella sp. A23]|uniref:hybrid sensor histidine kinase/response regulator n=1 Tax=Terasakiella sp. FCG-A23 TaxID=3080561 RepID=UPI002955B521|nr:ATP-binding protein [Terasakiella sp. A23]MDV7339979.1 ATP-binding protein [Terasakiella sp. A23]